MDTHETHGPVPTRIHPSTWDLLTGPPWPGTRDGSACGRRVRRGEGAFRPLPPTPVYSSPVSVVKAGTVNFRSHSKNQESRVGTGPVCVTIPLDRTPDLPYYPTRYL